MSLPPPLSFEGYRSRNPMAGGKPVEVAKAKVQVAIFKDSTLSQEQVDRLLAIRKQNQEIIAQTVKELLDHSVVSYGSLAWRDKRQRLETKNLMAEIEAVIGPWSKK
jgi:hypothetical protein